MTIINNDFFKFISKNKKCILLSVILVFFSFLCQAQNWDIDVLKDINLHRNRSLDNLFRIITDSAAPIAYSVPVFLVVLSFILKDRTLKIKSAFIISASVLALVIETIVKHLVNRPRPFITYPFIQNITSGSSPSFPSGHTSDAFTLAASLSFAFPKWYVILPSFCWAIAVGYSRMDLGVHYPSDILGSIVIGILCPFICFKIKESKEKRALNGSDG